MDIGIMKRHRVLSGLAGAAALASMVHAQQIPDLDEDGRISFDEFALALRNRLQNQPIRDLDGNVLQLLQQPAERREASPHEGS